MWTIKFKNIPYIKNIKHNMFCSSVIEEIKYDTTNNTLYVLFFATPGYTYACLDVPEELALELAMSSSPGSLFSHKIKYVYDVKKYSENSIHYE